MRITRPISLPMHGAIEFLCGLAMMFAPALLGFSLAGWIVSILLGAILTGTAADLTSRSGIPLASHVGFDSVFLLATGLAALSLAAAGQTRPVVFLAAIVVVLAGLGASTRYAGAPDGIGQLN